MHKVTTKTLWIAIALLLSSGTGLCAPYKIYIFMGETCPVSRHYTLTLKKLHAEYASEKLEFIGVFPNRLSTPATIAAFKEKYALPFTCIGDATHTLGKPTGGNHHARSRRCRHIAHRHLSGSH